MSPDPIQVRESLRLGHGPARRDQGMSLIEVMMAIMILVLAVFAVFSAMSTGRAMADTNQVRARVLAMIQAQLEVIQSNDKATVLHDSDINWMKYDVGVAGLTAPAGRHNIIQVRQMQQLYPATFKQPAGTNAQNLIVLQIDAQWVSRQLSDTYSTESISPILYYYAFPASP